MYFFSFFPHLFLTYLVHYDTLIITVYSDAALENRPQSDALYDFRYAGEREAISRENPAICRKEETLDKNEYKIKADEIKALIAQGEYQQAAEIADSIDWRRVKSIMMLCTISDLYKINRRYEDSRDILLIAITTGYSGN